MAAPWEKYQPAPAGPWDKYGGKSVGDITEGEIGAAADVSTFAQPPIRTPGELARRGLGSALDVATVGTIDEITGGLEGALDWSQGGSFREGYERGRYRTLAEQEAFAEEDPAGKIITGVAGGALTLPIGGANVFRVPQAAARTAPIAERLAAGGQRALNTAANATVTGGIYGGAYGAGSAEGGALKRLQGGIEGIPQGAVFGAAAGAVAAPFVARSAKVMAPGELERLQLSETFRVPLTKGEATQDLAQQAREQGMRNVAKGEKAAGIMKDFETYRTGEMTRAGEDVRGQIAGGQPRVQSEFEAGQAAYEGVRAKAAAHKAEAKRQYRLTGIDDPNATNVPIIRAEALKQARQDIKDNLLKTNFPFDPKQHPAAWDMVSEIDATLGMQMVNDKLLGPAALRRSSLNGVDLRAIETTRQRLGKYVGANDADKVAVGHVRRAFDEWVDDAVDNALFSGDPDALVALKTARREYRQYKKITDPKGGDDADKIIANMVKRDVNGQEVANYLYGTSIVRPPKHAARLAERLQKNLGADSEEWNAIRQAAWLKVMQGPRGPAGPQQIASNVDQFLNRNGRPLAEVLFTPTERSLMTGYGKLAKVLVPDPRATNPSKSSYGVARLITPLKNMLAMSLGFTAGGPAGAAVAPGMLKGIEGGIGARQARKAISYNPKLNAPLFTDPKTINRLLAPPGRFLIPYAAPEGQQ